jgi:hypothetical protein
MPSPLAKFNFPTIYGQTPMDCMCRHCKKFGRDHADGKCLFDSTTYDPMTEKEFYEWYGDQDAYTYSGSSLWAASKRP